MSLSRILNFRLPSKEKTIFLEDIHTQLFMEYKQLWVENQCYYVDVLRTVIEEWEIKLLMKNLKEQSMRGDVLTWQGINTLGGCLFKFTFYSFYLKLNYIDVLMFYSRKRQIGWAPLYLCSEDILFELLIKNIWRKREHSENGSDKFSKVATFT